MRTFARLRDIEPSVVLIVAGLALACYLQGAFFPRAQALVAVPLVVGVLLAPRLPVLVRADRPAVLTASGLAGWALLDGVLTGHALSGIRYLLLITGLLVLAAVCREYSDVVRGALRNGLLGLCGGIAVIGWLGVVFHRAPWGFGSAGMWRASSTLTYPNATAAILAMAALVCLALRGHAPTSRWLGGAATVVLTGLAATLSRAGVGGLLIGLVLLGIGIGWRPLLRGAVAPLIGAMVATVGLVPAITERTLTPVTIVIAGVAAVIGLVIGSRVVATRPVLVAFWAVLVTSGVLLSVRVASRFTFSSPDRWGSFRAAWNVFLGHPLTGAGPGIAQLVLARASGGVSVYAFVHNEYLQVLAELGVIGAVLLMAFIALAMRRLWRGRGDGDALRVGGLAALAALALHAGFDFVWHIPAVPLLGAAFVGLAMPQQNRKGNE